MKPPNFRIGFGYDVHRLVEGRRMVLGGVQIDHPRGLAGHSDADVLTHAVMDAILGAAGLGDIGMHFPDTDPRYKDADSLFLLERVMRLIGLQGLAVGNIDATVVLQQPRLAPHRRRIQETLAGVVSAPFNLKATTTEGLAFTGRGEGVAAYAVALLVELCAKE